MTQNYTAANKTEAGGSGGYKKSAGLTAKSVLGKNCWLALKAGLKIFWNLIGRKQFAERRTSLLRKLQSRSEMVRLGNHTIGVNLQILDSVL